MRIKTFTRHQGLLDDNSAVEPPEPIPNSEVKRSSADGSVGFPHVRVGHRQALILKSPIASRLGIFFALKKVMTREAIGVFRIMTMSFCHYLSGALPHVK